MLIPFSKYHGTGNDFIMIDNRELKLELSQNQIAQLCNRRFGIGADGLILLQMEERTVRMVYFNSDGAPSSMCGNGGRCFVDFAQNLNVLRDEGEFLAVDGMHPFKMTDSLVSLKMGNVSSIEAIGDAVYMDTGSPHYVTMVDEVLDIDIISDARKVRYNERFSAKGTNVNFVEMMDGVTHIRTYERGVEDETLSCGTGATAAAIAMHHLGNVSETDIPVKVLGGKVSVSFKPEADGSYTDIWLTGPTAHVFDGKIALPE
ncbi:MAG: diaminopimelate epimerase [Flavobacteriales bacterium]|jgi:diaminopimelate epimerase|nr:diaminopimelate epimerase [Flavobacteriales bacterium]